MNWCVPSQKIQNDDLYHTFFLIHSDMYETCWQKIGPKISQWNAQSNNGKTLANVLLGGSSHES